jgi:hypothetical protein
MWVYWILFLLPASVASLEQPRLFSNAAIRRERTWSGASVLLGLTIAVVIGFRHSVGGDWGAYLQQFEDIYGMSFGEALTAGDPGYALLNWLCGQMGWDIYAVNLFCGFIFAFGLVRFSLSLPRPWLACTVAIPYMVIVVAMGYTRQGVALGFTMLGLVALQRKSTVAFVLLALAGATFHKTAVLVIPIAALAHSRNRFWTVVFAGITTFVAYLTLLEDAFEDMYTNYIGAELQSEGALVRLAMNGLAAVLLLMWERKFQLPESERSLWRWIAVISLAMLVTFFAVPAASTALDRMALYLLPLQLVVFSRLPDVVGKGRNARMVAAIVVLFYGTVQFTWLNYATYANYWIPYRSYLQGDL